MKCFAFKETLPSIHTNIQSSTFIFLVVFMEREEEKKHPRNEMRAADTVWKESREEANNVVYLQEGRENRHNADTVCTAPAPTALELHTLSLTTWKHTVTNSCQERKSRYIQTCSLVL